MEIPAPNAQKTEFPNRRRRFMVTKFQSAQTPIGEIDLLRLREKRSLKGLNGLKITSGFCTLVVKHRKDQERRLAESMKSTLLLWKKC